MHTMQEFAQRALTGGYIGIPYSKLDCQGFVEKVLADIGVKGASGTPYNWKGSNSMWRNAVNWKGTIEEGKAKFGGELPPGILLFTVKHDGGEKARGYNDTEGNAAHVGIYCGGGIYIHSTTTNTANGVQKGVLPHTRWTHCGTLKMLQLDNTPIIEDNTNTELILEKLDAVIASIRDVINALKG